MSRLLTSICFLLCLISLGFAQSSSPIKQQISTSVTSTSTPAPVPSVFLGEGNQNPPASLVINFLSTKESVAEEQLRQDIASIMGIPVDNVLVTRYTFVSATVIICSGNIPAFISAVNERDEVVEGTQLEGATITTVIWQVPCQEPDISYSEPDFNSPDSFSQQTSDYGRDDVLTSFPFSSEKSSFDFPIQDLPSSQQYSDANVVDRFIAFTVALLFILL